MDLLEMASTVSRVAENGDQGWTPRYVHTLIYFIAMASLVVGGLNTLTMGLGVNVLEGLVGRFAVVPYLWIGLCTVYVMFNRDTYLPFLGSAHLPCSALEPRTPTGASHAVVVNGLPPRAKVLYWAAEPAMEGLKNIPSWKGAYLGYDNTGVTMTDESGQAVLRVRTPQSYHVPIHGLLEPHIHYRVCEESGWLGRVMTVPVTGAPGVEPFSGPEEEAMAMWI